MTKNQEKSLAHKFKNWLAKLTPEQKVALQAGLREVDGTRNGQLEFDEIAKLNNQPISLSLSEYLGNVRLREEARKKNAAYAAQAKEASNELDLCKKPTKDRESRQVCEVNYNVRLAEVDFAHGVKTSTDPVTKFVQIADSILKEQMPLPFTAKEVVGVAGIMQKIVAHELAASKLADIPIVGKPALERMMKQNIQEINLILQEHGMPVIAENYAGAAIDAAKKPTSPSTNLTPSSKSR